MTVLKIKQTHATQTDPKTNIMQKYIVEIFNKHFVKVAHYGPVPYKKAYEEAARLKLDGFQVLITEEDMVTDDAEWVQELDYNKSMQIKWTFDKYLEYQLKGLSFLTEGKFTSMDVRKYFSSPTMIMRERYAQLAKLYREQFKAWWNWDDFNDRIHRHLNRVVTAAGGEREKVKNKWVYTLDHSAIPQHGDPMLPPYSVQ